MWKLTSHDCESIKRNLVEGYQQVVFSSWRFIHVGGSKYFSLVWLNYRIPEFHAVIENFEQIFHFPIVIFRTIDDWKGSIEFQFDHDWPMKNNSKIRQFQGLGISQLDYDHKASDGSGQGFIHNHWFIPFLRIFVAFYHTSQKNAFKSLFLANQPRSIWNHEITMLSSKIIYGTKS